MPFLNIHKNIICSIGYAPQYEYIHYAHIFACSCIFIIEKYITGCFSILFERQKKFFSSSAKVRQKLCALHFKISFLTWFIVLVMVE